MSILIYNGQNIEQRDTDGMVNLTQMAAANAVLVNDWRRLKSTEQYINQLSLDEGIPATNILTSDRQDGTWAHYLLAVEFGRWISPAFAIWCDKHIHRLVTTGTTSLESNRQKLEDSMMDRPTLKQIEQAGKVYGRLFGKAYEQQYIQQKYQRWYPALAGQQADPSQVASLPSTKHRLTPSAIAKELGLLHGTGSPNGNAANKLMGSLGYQSLVGKTWIPTDKAIDAGYVDRKPVDTNSRSQKDQLLWSADILPILQEHVGINGGAK